MLSFDKIKQSKDTRNRKSMTKGCYAVKHIRIIILISLFVLMMLGCKNTEEPDNNHNNNEALLDETMEVLDVFDGSIYKGSPLPNTYNGVSITYAVADDNRASITDDTIVLTRPAMGPKDITVEIELRRDSTVKHYTETVLVMPVYSADDFKETSLLFTNVSDHFTIESHVVSIYQIDNGIPYVSVDAFLAMVSPAIHDSSLKTRREENQVTYTLSRGTTYTMRYNFDTTILTFNHSDFFSNIGVYQPMFSMIEACGSLCRVSYHSADRSDRTDASFDLGYYGMQFIQEEDSVYAPLALLNELFSGPYYDVTYTGSQLTGYDMLTLRDELFLDLVYPPVSLSMMADSYKAQTYHYLALVLDIFYGLDGYFDIADFYAILDPFETALLDENIDAHYEGIVDVMLSFDERHTGIRYHGFYKGDQVINPKMYEFGPRVSQLRERERWLKDNYCEDESLVEVSEDGTLARVRFNQFMQDEYLAFLDALDTLDGYPNLDSVIVDVSCNSGGLLSILLSASGLFTDDAFDFAYINTLHDEHASFSIISPLDQLPYTLYVQTSEFSYSAAHIFTTYIDMYDLATIIGQPTGGGAAAIRDMVLPNGSHIVISSPLVFVGSDDTIIEMSHDPDIYIPYDAYDDLETVKSYLD